MNRFVAKVNPEDGETFVVDQYGPKDDIKGVGYRLCLCVEEGVAILIAEALTKAGMTKPIHHVPFRQMTKDELLALPPIKVEEVGKLTGLLWVGAGNVYAAIEGAHGDNFLASTGIRNNYTFSLDTEGEEWVEVSDGLGPNGELL